MAKDKRPTVSELRQAAPVELKEKVKQLKAELFQLRVAAKQAKLDKPHLLRTRRHEIARILTILQEKTHDQSGV